MMRTLVMAMRTTLVLWVLTALIYPGLMLFVGQVIFPYQANGSLIENQGKIVGSALIGQTFSNPRYFLSRPSSIGYSEGKEAAPTGLSGTSNFAPSNPDLIKRVQTSQAQLRSQGIAQPTADLVYVSGSGLDPHITVEAAQAQVNRVAGARSLSANQIHQLIAQNTDPRFLRLFGEPGVNVLKLNLALDQLASSNRSKNAADSRHDS
jgi:potassium-transporting ATPase KdpC subunit